jgi:hypothetical protein
MSEARSGKVLDPVASRDDGCESDLTDDELTALALAADPDAPIAKDAVPMALYLGQLPISLPGWYMPTVMLRGRRGWRMPVVLLIVASFVVIEALGLCNTFGQLTLP